MWRCGAERPYSFLGVPDFFVTSQQIKLWRDSDYRDDKDVFRWYNGYQKPKSQKSDYTTRRLKEAVEVTDNLS